MTTATEALFTPVQYFTALDPYNWQVDNRPLSDLEANEVILSEGVETALHAGKLNSSALGVLIRALCGSSTSMTGKITLSGIALNLTIEYSVFTSKKATYLGENSIHLVAVQPDAVSFALTAPAAGYKKLYTISVRYQDPNEDLPYFDPALPLDPTQIATGTLEYSIASNTALLVGGTYPSPPPYFWEVIQIEVLSTDVSINPGKVTYPYQYFIPEGQAFNYASQTRQGQVLFATPTEVTTGTNTTKAVTPADLKGRIDAIGSPTLDFVTTTDGLKYGINANLRVPPNYLGPTVDFNTVLTSGKWYCEASGPGYNRPPFSTHGILTVEGSAETVYGDGFWIQSYVDNVGRTYNRRIHGINAAFPNTTFERWTESFTRYRVVEVSNVTTFPGLVGTDPCLINFTAEDFSHHTMIIASMYAPSGVNVEIRVAVGEVAKLRLGEMVHIRKFSSGAGNKNVTIIDEGFLATHNPNNVAISPFGDYVMPRNNSTISLVVTKVHVTGGGNHNVTLSVIGEMP